MTQMFVKRQRKGSPAVPADFQLKGRHGNRVYFELVTEDGLVLGIGGVAQPLAAKLRELADAIDRPVIEAALTPQSAGTRLHTAANWDWLTPEYVIQYFERSPHLSSMSDDVRAALEPLCRQPRALPPPKVAEDVAKLLPLREELLNDDGSIRYGAKSRVARELGGQPAGTFYYNRVLPALAALTSSSTGELTVNDDDYDLNVA